jgi:ABC-type uncharacterized transport system substrate-binding protein
MKRREFISLLSVTAAWPLHTRAQPSGTPVIGYLDPGTLEQNTEVVRAFQQGLRDLGFTEGRNVLIEYRWADARYDQLVDLATELAKRRVTVIAATNGIPAARAAKAATADIPIVFFVGVDPVAFGLVASLNRPGGNITGVTGLGTALGAKRLELLHLLTPRADRMAALINPEPVPEICTGR